MARAKSGKEIIEGLKRDLERFGVQCDEDKPSDPWRERLLSSASHDSCIEAVRHLEAAIGYLPAPKSRNLPQQVEAFRKLRRAHRDAVWKAQNGPEPS